MLAGATYTTGSTLTGGPNGTSTNYKPNEAFYIANGVDTTYGMWTLSPYSTTAIIVFKPRVGFFKETPYAGNGGRSVKPVIVLKSTTEIKGGDGTKDTPYIIKY